MPTANAIRPAAVAGSFYPADAFELADSVQTFLDQANPDTSHSPKAIIAPHAGYVYSGATAGKIYKTLASAADRISRVVLIGPSHRVALHGLAASSASGFATPLGVIPLDTDAIRQLETLPQVQIQDAAHELEHSLEVHLPFLQCLLRDFSLVPLVAGDISAAEVSEVLDVLWGGPETLIVISSDLSHFLDYDAAVEIDTNTSTAIESFSETPLSGEQACGCIGINGLLHRARKMGMRCERLGLCNSGDTAGSRDRVVGYGAWGFFATQDSPEEDGKDSDNTLTPAERERLLKIASLSIKQGLEKGKPLDIDVTGMTETLVHSGASFVTLTIDGQLRGCIGSLEATRPLAQDVARNAWSAAFKDPRFSPLQENEFDQLDLHISVLTKAQPMAFDSEQELLALLQPGIDGLIIQQGSRRATYLPSVWESLPDPESFLDQLKLKAGIVGTDPDTPLQAWRYTTIQF